MENISFIKNKDRLFPFSKEELTQLNIGQFQWWGFVNGFHQFRRRTITGQYENLRALASDITDKSIEYMVEYRLTR